MERCINCRYWQQDDKIIFEGFGDCWCKKFVSYEGVQHTTAKGKHIISNDPLIKTHKDFGCINFESKPK